MVEFAGLGSAFLWAVGSVLARAQSRHVDAVTLNLTRAAAASAMYLVILVATGRTWEILHLPGDALLLLLGAVITSMAIGDTVFFASMSRLGAARAMPISGVYPLFGVLLAAPMAGEPLSARLLAGSALVVVGVTLVATARVRAETPPGAGAAHDAGPPASALLPGVLLALFAAVMWALGTVLLKMGAVDVDVLVANSVRIPAATISLLLYRQLWLAPRTALPRPTPTLLVSIAVTGIIGSGVGGALYVLSAQAIGAGRTATLGSTAPLFAAPLAAIFLKEPLGPRMIAGSLLSCAGVWLLY